MFFRQYYLDCLSHASYLVGDTTTGRAVVVDPQRDVAEYVADAREHGLTIEYFDNRELAGEPVATERGPRRQVTRASDQRAATSSAICTALRAAPLRRLSLLTNSASPRPSGTPGSWRSRPT